MLTALPTASIIRAALWGFGQLFLFSEFFDNPGQSLIQSAKYLLSWFRIGRYQCPPRKEPQDTRFATSPTRHRIAGCERSVRAVRFPKTQVSIVSIALRDQLIHNILVWRAVQRESLTRQGSKAGKTRVRTGRESDRFRWEPEEKSQKKTPSHFGGLWQAAIGIAIGSLATAVDCFVSFTLHEPITCSLKAGPNLAAEALQWQISASAKSQWRRSFFARREEIWDAVARSGLYSQTPSHFGGLWQAAIGIAIGSLATAVDCFVSFTLHEPITCS